MSPRPVPNMGEVTHPCAVHRSAGERARYLARCSSYLNHNGTQHVCVGSCTPPSSQSPAYNTTYVVYCCRLNNPKHQSLRASSPRGAYDTHTHTHTHTPVSALTIHAWYSMRPHTAIISSDTHTPVSASSMLGIPSMSPHTDITRSNTQPPPRIQSHK